MCVCVWNQPVLIDISYPVTTMQFVPLTGLTSWVKSTDLKSTLIKHWRSLQQEIVTICNLAFSCDSLGQKNAFHQIVFIWTRSIMYLTSFPFIFHSIHFSAVQCFPSRRYLVLWWTILHQVCLSVFCSSITFKTRHACVFLLFSCYRRINSRDPSCEQR